METTETEPIAPAPAPQPQLILGPEAQSYLREAAKWAKFLSIIGFIFCGLILIVAIFAGSVLTAMSSFTGGQSAMPAAMGGVVSVIYILIDVLYFFFPYYLYQFSDKIKKGIVFTDNAHITAGLGKLKSFFKLWAIVTIVVICFYVLIFAIIIIAGVGAASFMHR